MHWLRHQSDRFRMFLSTSCCTCLSSVPSFALVVIAVVLVMLLIASIPLAFALTYMNPQASVGAELMRRRVPELVHRYHRLWSNANVTKRIDDEETSIFRTRSMMPPNITICRGFGFSCTSEPGKVIGTNQRCDGHRDCKDGSDESDCRECHTTFSCAYKGHTKICLRGNSLCHKDELCPDNSHNSFCHEECDRDEHKCDKYDRCLPKEMVCDGDPHCPLGDDEMKCTECKNGSKLCPFLSDFPCIPKWKLCDGIIDCKDGSDEHDCDCTSCSGNGKVLCTGERSFCTQKSKICDGNSDCPGGEDEQLCPGTCPPIDSYHTDIDVVCADGLRRPWYQACNGTIQECDHSCESCNLELAFECTPHSYNETDFLSVLKNQSKKNDSFLKIYEKKNGLLTKQCIDKSFVCDGKTDCFNGADEEKCNCPAEGMNICSDSIGLIRPRCYSVTTQRCNGYNDCSDGEDETDCDSCIGESAFYCKKDRKCISATARCNGVDDCDDLSDELDCSCAECSRQPLPMYKCTASERCFRFDGVCNPYSKCPNATKLDESFCATRVQPNLL